MIGALATGSSQESTSRVGIGDRDPGELAAARRRHQFKDCSRDDSQRSLSAQEEPVQIVAGVVLTQPLEIRHDLAARQHHLESQYEIPGCAVTQYRDAAGIRCEVTADLTRALRTHAQWEQ